MARISVEECRRILGSEAEGYSDERIERLRDALEGVAEVMYDEIKRQAQSDPEAVRWASYAFENPEDAFAPDLDDAELFDDGANTLSTLGEQPDSEVVDGSKREWVQ